MMTHSKTFPAVSFGSIVAAAIIAGAPAMAQTDTTGATASGAETRADQITCAQLTQMDTAVVPGTLYFVAGYDRGMSDSMNLSDPAGTGSSSTTGTDMSADTTGTESSSTTGTELSSDTTGTDSSSMTTTDLSADTTGTDSSSTTTDLSADTTGTDSSTTTDLATGSDTATSTTGTSDTTGATDSATGAVAQIGHVSGFFEIPVETIVTACADAPERSVSDVVKEQGGMSGTQAN